MITKEILQTGEAVISRPEVVLLKAWFKEQGNDLPQSKGQDAFGIPTQWDTFRLGDNPPGFPILDLKREIQQRNLDSAPFRILDIGQIKVIK